MDAKKVPTIAARRRRTIVGAGDNFPQRPSRLDPSVHSLNNAATSAVDFTLYQCCSFDGCVPSINVGVRYDRGDQCNNKHF